jgi:hypothetical protein
VPTVGVPTGPTVKDERRSVQLDQESDVKPCMRECKLISGVHFRGTLKDKSAKQTDVKKSGCSVKKERKM